MKEPSLQLYKQNHTFTLNEPDSPILNTELACKIGFYESVTLLQLASLMTLSNNEQDGVLGIYQSVSDFQEKSLPFLPLDTVNKAFKSLKEKKLIMTKPVRNKRLLWITLNFEEFEKLNCATIYQN